MSDRIIYFKVENAKSVVLAEGKPSGDFNIVGGPNKSGKSGLMQTLAGLLGGKKYLPPEPVKEGRGKASAKIETERYIASMVVPKSGNPKWKVEAKNGDEIIKGTAHAFLKSLIGDSRMFANMEYLLTLKDRDRVTFIKDLLDIDVSEIDEEYKTVYKKRALVNQEIKDQNGVISQIPFEVGLPEEVISLDTLIGLYEKAQHNNAKREVIEARVIDLHIYIKAMLQELDEREEQLENMPAANIAEIKLNMEEIESYNERIRKGKQRREAYIQRDALETHSAHLTETLDTLLSDRKKALEGVQMPRGLEFIDDGLVWKGRPFHEAQLSSAEMLEILVEIAFSTLPEDKLRVVLLDGASFDEDSLAGLEDVAKRCDGQIFVEVPTKVKEGCRFYFKQGTMEQVNDE